MLIKMQSKKRLLLAQKIIMLRQYMTLVIDNYTLKQREKNKNETDRRKNHIYYWTSL